jgi:hypothetical protein
MAGLINLRLLTDFFNKIDHQQRFEHVSATSACPRFRMYCCLAVNDIRAINGRLPFPVIQTLATVQVNFRS